MLYHGSETLPRKILVLSLIVVAFKALTPGFRLKSVTGMTCGWMTGVTNSEQ
ncbi:MAG: hypothetical protein ACJAT8_001310 [Cellvibrionaceae bacterium]|jgi:hypothetical protein